MLDQFGAFGAGKNQPRRNLRLCRPGDRQLVLAVLPGSWRCVDALEKLGRALRVGADDDAVGIQEVCDRTSFAQKLGLETTLNRSSGAPLRIMVRRTHSWV